MANLLQALLQRNFALDDGELCVGEIPITRLAGQHGTPLFVYDLDTFSRKYAQLKAALPRQFSICYSVKANPNPAVLRHFLSLGCGLEIASAGEFQHGVEAGCKPANMLFAGPGKTEAELEFVLANHIGEIHLESETEARRVSAISRRLGIRARVAIRVNPAGEAEGGAMRMGGRPAPFGIDEETLEGFLQLILGDEALKFRGIHLFTGTQILDANVLLTQYRHGLKIARKAAQIAGAPIDCLDFGGGLGIPYFAHEEELNFEHLREGMATLFVAIESDPAFAGTEFLVEPGRFLAGEAGVYVARIIDIKVSRGKKFLIVDGGMNHHLAASGNLGQTIKRNYPVALLNKLDGAVQTETVDVVGPLCTPLDTLARNVDLPHAEIGDLFGIFQSGAYGFSASPLGFLSHASPAEVVVQSGKATLARHRGQFSEALLGSST
jgi:diaminopimelate decarboxylase